MGENVRELGKCEIFGIKCEKNGSLGSLFDVQLLFANLKYSQISHI